MCTSVFFTVFWFLWLLLYSCCLAEDALCVCGSPSGNLIASHMPTRSGDLHSMCIFSSFYAQVWLLCNCVLLIHVMASLWFEIGYVVDMTVSEMQLYTGLF